MSAPQEILRALSDLWQLQPPAPDNLYSEPAFIRLRITCQEIYPSAGDDMALNFALSIALRSFGLPCGLSPWQSELALPVELVAERLVQAFCQIQSKRIHLCPLDCADNLPALNFGPNSIRKFSPKELETLVNSARLRRFNSTWNFEKEKFSKFNWLVVKEAVCLDGKPGARVIRGLFDGFDARRDFGEIIPHSKQFPAAVEHALFALLLVPWEDLTMHRKYDWRGFRVPWVYTVDEDIFERPKPPPSPDTLSWVPIFNTDGCGNTIEEEGPIKIPLISDIDQKLSWLNDTNWDKLCAALTSPLFATPIEHFLVRAFLEDGIDEFLAHMTIVEAALGMKKDFVGRERPKFCDSSNPGNKNAGATARVANRLSNLLKRHEVGVTFKHLFNLRSEYLHGRKMSAISSSNKNSARMLGREVTEGLISSALENPAPVSREKYLDDLLGAT